MDILVVGGAGYIGCVLVEKLFKRGHSVRVYDSLLFGDRAIREISPQVELIKKDISDVAPCDLERIDAVVNLGGISSDPTAEFNPQLTYRMNVEGAVRLAKACKQAGVRRYLFASSCSVYDANIKSDVIMDESSEVAPISAYASSKYEAEQQLLALADTTFCPVLLRKGTVFGFSPRMRYDLVINTLLKDALSRNCMTLQAGGEMWRPVIEINDAAQAYVVCLEADESVVHSAIFNVVYSNFRVSEMALRIREALRNIAIDTDIHAIYNRHPKFRSYQVSGKKFEDALRFKPQFSIEDSVRKMVPKTQEDRFCNFDEPIFYNIQWFEKLGGEEV